MLIGREQIESMIPHGPSMCLLDEVVAWDQAQIHCRSRVLASANPLWPQGATSGELPTPLLIEYAAQAAAVHAALLQTGLGQARAAYLGAIKKVRLLANATHSDHPLDIRGQRELSSPAGAIYPFTVSQHNTPLIEGRLLLSQS